MRISQKVKGVKMHNLRHTNFYMNTNILYNFDIWIKRGLHCHIYPTFSLHFIYWKSLDECFTDKNILHISLTKFNKLNKRRKRTFSINQFTFALYLAFIFCTFSVYLWLIVWSTSVSVQFFWLEVKKMCYDLSVLSS